MRIGFGSLRGALLALGPALLLMTPAVASAQNPVVSVRALQSGASAERALIGAEKALAELAGLQGRGALQQLWQSGRINSLFGEPVPLERLMSRIQSNPDLAGDPDVLYFLVEVGQGRIALETRSPRLLTIANELPGQERLVTSISEVLAGQNTAAATCNPLTQWMGSGYFPEAIPGTMPLTTQEATLAAILRAPGDVIEIDLDGTALMPITRIVRALKATGARYNIEEFNNPEVLEVLPFYTGGAFTNFIERTGIAERYPDLDWRASDTGTRGAVYSYFRGQYWGGDLTTDQVTPGLAQFIQYAAMYDKTVVFVSGRSRGWRAPSIAALEFGGVESPNLLIGNTGGDAETKRRAQQEIRERWGVPVAFTDDRIANRAAVVAVEPQTLNVPIVVPGLSSENALVTDGLGISTFEIREQSLPPREQ